jgi:hypothetical protein
LTTAQAQALAMNPGGAAYQNEIFSKAKSALSAQHGVDWKDYYAVAVSFQSPDYGAQGGTFDGGPGVFMDIRYVLGNGIEAWGQEMGHAFGLDHSRREGSDDDYKDPWDVMSTRAAFSAADGNFGRRGPGLNAWNMRGRQWLDETRVWKGAANTDFHETINLRPLHSRSLDGFLCAELPGIGNDSAHLVEFRVPHDWDAGIGKPVVLVHRFLGPINQFLGTHSYLMPGTAGQPALDVGDTFEVGLGPYSRVQVIAIDDANHFATVRLCYSKVAKPMPKVKIGIPNNTQCAPALVAGAFANFKYKLSGTECRGSYQVVWNVAGSMPAPMQPPDKSSFNVLCPDPSITATVTVTVVFDDGTTISDSLQFQSISGEVAAFRELICKVLHERLKPHPWWEFNPAAYRDIAKTYSGDQLKLAYQSIEQLLGSIRRVIDQRQ